jgi:hypothetical protein
MGNPDFWRLLRGFSCLTSRHESRNGYIVPRESGDCEQPIARLLCLACGLGIANRCIDARSPQLSSTEMHTEIAPALQSLPTSNAEAAMNPRTEELVESGDSRVQDVVKAAGEDLRQLLQQRDEIVKQIRTMKQTIMGVARLFGDDRLSQELWELVGRKGGPRQSGLTKSCRTVLMEANRPLGAHEVCEQVRRCIPLVFANHKSPAASVTTVLNRLVEYGEALAVRDENGRRAWQWCTQERALRESGDRSA